MRKLLSAFVLLLLLTTMSSTLAATSTITFNITTVSPILQSCVNTPLPYEIVTINATTTGDYTFTVVNPDYNFTLNLYLGGTFTTANLCTNRINGTVTSMTQTLTAGQSYSLVAVRTGPTNTGTFDVTLGSPAPVAVVANVAPGDPDSDGIDNSLDNCINDYNPGQEDGWGSSLGDSCDTEWYNQSDVAVEGFVQKAGMFNLHGNCTFFADGASSCPVIASFDPKNFTSEAMPLEISSDDANGWSVWLYYLHNNNGVDVYQVNVYSSNPPRPDTLVDDHLEIHINGGSWQWYQRGGDPAYHGI